MDISKAKKKGAGPWAVWLQTGPSQAFETHYQDNWQNYARFGAILGLGISRELTRRISIKAEYKSWVHWVSEQQLQEALERQLPGYSWQVVADNWYMNGLFYGISYKLYKHPEKKFKPEIYLDPGIIWIQSPFLAYQGQGSYPNKIHSIQYPSSTSTMAMNWGLVLPLDLGGGFQVGMELNHTSLSPVFDKVDRTINGESSERTYQELISLLGTSVVLRYRP